jgi:hypothetical protein
LYPFSDSLSETDWKFRTAPILAPPRVDKKRKDAYFAAAC